MGNCDLSIPIKVNISESSLSLVSDEDQDNWTVAFILKKDIRKIEHSDSGIPFLCLYLTQGSYSRTQKKLGIDRKTSEYDYDVKRRIFIIYNLENLLVDTLSKPYKVINFLSIHFLQTSLVELGPMDAFELLTGAGHGPFAILFSIEYGWIAYFNTLPVSEKNSYEVTRSTDNRKISSYCYFFAFFFSISRRDFVWILVSLVPLVLFREFLYSIFWHPCMIFDQCLDFIAIHQCSNLVCTKFSLVKCSACKVARYCDQECQEMDLEQHRPRCPELKKRRKENHGKQIAKSFFKSEKLPRTETSGLSYEYFISKIQSKIFEHYGDMVTFDLEGLKDDLTLRNVTLSDSLAQCIQELKTSIKNINKLRLS
eukprot:GFUD01022435.1.p1 GENE.GFUD01022435.1~~GFUD01022435.1.p1  ORF type:complete len:385 (-),score=47.23 GFUD01022435.1:54-1157(-)